MVDASLGIFIKPYEAYQKCQSSHFERGELQTDKSASASPTLLPGSPSRRGSSANAMTEADRDMIGCDGVSSEDVRRPISNDSSHHSFNHEKESLKKLHNARPTSSAERSNGYHGKTSKIIQKPSYSSRSALNTAGAMGWASGKSLCHFLTTCTKSALVDIPQAATEGLRVVPRLYGEKLHDHGNVTDWKSGVVVAAETFRYGMYEGLTDIFVLPYKESQESGPLGAVTGLGKGILSLGTKTSSAALGLVAYPADGIRRSIRTSVMRGTKRSIEEARYAEGAWIIQTAGGDHAEIFQAFDQMREGKGSTD
jgi:hypothetical protein